jgi:hypothetical protein
MMILVDHNLKGYIVLLRGTLAVDGWLDWLSIEFVTLEEAGLAVVEPSSRSREEESLCLTN